MAHVVINSPETGAVTWCSGIGCPRCEADRALNERIRRGEVAEWYTPGIGTWYGPPVINAACAIPFGTTVRFPAMR